MPERVSAITLLLLLSLLPLLLFCKLPSGQTLTSLSAAVFARPPTNKVLEKNFKVAVCVYFDVDEDRLDKYVQEDHLKHTEGLSCSDHQLSVLGSAYMGRTLHCAHNNDCIAHCAHCNGSTVHTVYTAMTAQCTLQVQHSAHCTMLHCVTGQGPRSCSCKLSTTSYFILPLVKSRQRLNLV